MAQHAQQARQLSPGPAGVPAHRGVCVQLGHDIRCAVCVLR